MGGKGHCPPRVLGWTLAAHLHIYARCPRALAQDKFKTTEEILHGNEESVKAFEEGQEDGEQEESVRTPEDQVPIVAEEKLRAVSRELTALCFCIGVSNATLAHPIPPH